MHIGGQCFLVNVECVALAQLIQEIGLGFLHDGEGAFGFLLAGKQVHHSVDSLGLEVLGFEFKFHVVILFSLSAGVHKVSFADSSTSRKFFMQCRLDEIYFIIFQVKFHI